MHSDIDVEVVSDPSALDTLAADWDRLLAAQSVHNVLLDPRFVACWWRHYGAGLETRTVVLRRGGQIAGIVPLALGRAREAWPTRGRDLRIADDYRHVPGLRRLRWVRVRRLCFPLCFAASSIRAQLLVADDDPALVEALLRYVGATAADWDVLSLDGIPAGSEQEKALVELAAKHGLRRGDQRHARCFLYADLPRSMDEFLAERSRSFRRWLRRARRDAESFGDSNGGLEIRSYRGSEIGAGLECLFALERTSWKVASTRRRELHMHLDDRDRRFHREVATVFAARDDAEILVTEVGGRPVSALYCLERDGVSCGLLTYQDARSAGDVSVAPLWARFFELAIGRGLRRMDFNGNNEYLARYANGSVEARRMVFFNRGWRSRALGLLSDASTRMARALARR